MPRRHRVLTVLWLLMYVAFGVGVLTEHPVPLVVPFFGAMVLGVITYRAVVRDAHLRYRTAYKLLVGTLFASSAATTVGSGMTLFVTSGEALPVMGFFALGSTNLLLAILSWRALVSPSTRGAARVGMLAALFESFAMTLDIFLNMRKSGLDVPSRELGMLIALIGSMISIGTGGFACIAALVSFGPRQPDMPEARVVDGA